MHAPHVQKLSRGETSEQQETGGRWNRSWRKKKSPTALHGGEYLPETKVAKSTKAGTAIKKSNVIACDICGEDKKVSNNFLQKKKKKDFTYLYFKGEN